MKKLLVLLVTLFTLTINAQWETNFYVDEFGDKTGESYRIISTSGTFSNSATQNSKAVYHLIDSGKALTIDVYEYNRSLANSIEATFEKVKIKKPNGEIVSIGNVFFTKRGSLYFSKQRYTKIIENLKDTGKYVIIFKRSGKYSNSSYKINLTLN